MQAFFSFSAENFPLRIQQLQPPHPGEVRRQLRGVPLHSLLQQLRVQTRILCLDQDGTYQGDVYKRQGLQRELPICKVTDDLHIGAFICFGDAELTVACAKAMLELLEPGSYDYLFTAEAKSIPLIHEMARQSGAEKYFIARKGEKVYMPDPIHVEDKSITTAGTQRLYLGSDDAAMIRGKRIVLMDDVISTGGSLLAMEHLVELAGGIVVDRIAALAEGAAAQRKDIKFLAPLPVFNADGTIK